MVNRENRKLACQNCPICGIQLSIKDLTLLLTQNKTSLIKNMKSKNGKKFDAFIILRNDFSTSFEFGNKN
ncbi:topoisomerase C-terminal repeat-containing protein [Elizabethkingia bruuniana]|uniref:topoisomerase C-terminal repeat-containing protein n=1 Tax=Elizabethkingia bruuniana TaxID=1756149 RepID=UPI0021A5EE83|nr:topoisomerase C-terminal repeat-containing protein [Elizabethkingia bruuniana]